jgi:hypothetical protein
MPVRAAAGLEASPGRPDRRHSKIECVASASAFGILYADEGPTTVAAGLSLEGNAAPAFDGGESKMTGDARHDRSALKALPDGILS